MGVLNRVICRNKTCRYRIELVEGPGMLSGALMWAFREAVINGEVDNQYARERLLSGAKIDTKAAYVCPVCQELMNHDIYFLKENIVESPYGTVRYDVSFPFGEPQCPKCQTKLKYIQNVRSSKVKCPKCGGALLSKRVGFTD